MQPQATPPRPSVVAAFVRTRCVIEPNAPPSPDTAANPAPSAFLRMQPQATPPRPSVVAAFVRTRCVLEPNAPPFSQHRRQSSTLRILTNAATSHPATPLSRGCVRQNAVHPRTQRDPVPPTPPPTPAPSAFLRMQPQATPPRPSVVTAFVRTRCVLEPNATPFPRHRRQPQHPPHSYECSHKPPRHAPQSWLRSSERGASSTPMRPHSPDTAANPSTLRILTNAATSHPATPLSRGCVHQNAVRPRTPCDHIPPTPPPIQHPPHSYECSHKPPRHAPQSWLRSSERGASSNPMSPRSPNTAANPAPSAFLRMQPQATPPRPSVVAAFVRTRCVLEPNEPPFSQHRRQSSTLRILTNAATSHPATPLSRGCVRQNAVRPRTQ